MNQNLEKRSILVTSALPYANASLHLGHILEHTQTDIWVRFQRLCGNECTYGDTKRLYSHRRDNKCGRMASIIYMQK